LAAFFIYSLQAQKGKIAVKYANLPFAFMCYKMKFCNINFNVNNKSELFKQIYKNKTKIIIPANAALIVKANESERFFNILKNNYVTFDGRVPHFFAKFIFFFNGKKPKNKVYFNKILSGSDIVYDFCEYSKLNNYKIFFLGGKSENNYIAVNNIKNKYNIIIDGYSPDFEEYPFSDEFNNLCLEKIANFKPEILFVGFGAPKQEYWLDDNKEYISEIGVKYAIGCGGTFDFISQKIKRAPVFIQKIGLEGIFRFFQEPSIMRFRRLIDSFKFFKYIWCKPNFKKEEK